MTQNQIAYFNALENQRHNKVAEAETYRYNTLTTGETNRSNIVNERERTRSAIVTSNETNRSNLTSENIKYQQNAINNAHYQRQDAISAAALGETNRHNIASEKIGMYNVNIDQQKADTDQTYKAEMANQGRFSNINDYSRARNDFNIRSEQTAINRADINSQIEYRHFQNAVQAADKATKILDYAGSSRARKVQ